jgi:periplasmic mercuric ion binding protein
LQDIEQSKENTMKKLIVLAAVTALGTGAAQAAECTVKFSVDKMYCEACPLTVSKAMQGVKGVKSAKVDYNTKTAVVVFDDGVATIDAIAAASTNAGYPAQPVAN